MRAQAYSAVIPAVDVFGIEAVRLEQGDFGRVSHRVGDPLELVGKFAQAGAPLVHLVDLDGARWGRTRPGLVARAVAASGRAELQASGGVRSVDDALGLVAAGAARVVIGTAAFADSTLPRYVDALGERLVVAVDVRDGLVAVAGWARSTGLSAAEAAARCADAGVARVLCTAVERDGTLDGPDLALLESVRARFGGPVLAAGGVRSEDDLAALARVGVEAAVVGRALLDGSLPLSLFAAR